ncbi:MAG: helix-turn-helix transcriptional regulator [Vicinamibacterales bacterium]|nr:helix-turn-helix transcriptional regulator [Vicinamibacterales bacterium]
MPDRPRRDLAARHLPLTEPVFQILLSLADQALHGYAIIQDIRARTDGDVDLTASTLYAAVKRLMDAALIKEVPARSADDDPRRRYYQVTPLGLEVARLEAARLARTVRMARQKRLLPTPP